jgi:hypothetical protein
VAAESLQHQLSNQTKDSTIILREREVQELLNDNKFLKSIIEQKAKEHQGVLRFLSFVFSNQNQRRLNFCFVGTARVKAHFSCLRSSH